MPATLMQPPPMPCTTRMAMMEASVSQKPNPTVPPPRRTRPGWVMVVGGMGGLLWGVSDPSSVPFV